MIKENWKTKWRSIAQEEKLAAIEVTTPSDTLLKLFSNNNLLCKDSSIITQLCIGHIPLNGYLYKFKCVDNPRCPACRAAVKTVHHFLFTCHSYAYMHWPLEQKCKGLLTLRKILLDHKLTALLITYLEITK